MQSFLEISKNRYTTKHYDQDKKISQKDIDTLLEIARLTPSAVNIQPWHFYVGSTQKAKELILPAIPDFNIPRIRDCSHFIVLCSKTKMTKDEYDALTEQEDKDGRFGDPKLKEAIGSHRMEFGQMHEKLGDFSQWTAKQVYLVMAALLYEAAKERIETVLNLSLVESYPEGISEEEKSKYILYNSQIKLAHLMIAADYFNNREESGTANLEIIPNGAMRILTSIRRWNA